MGVLKRNVMDNKTSSLFSYTFRFFW